MKTLPSYGTAKEDLKRAREVYKSIKDIEFNPRCNPNNQSEVQMTIAYVTKEMEEHYALANPGHRLVHAFFTDFLCEAIKEKRDELMARTLEIAREQVLKSAERARKESEAFLARIDEEIKEFK